MAPWIILIVLLAVSSIAESAQPAFDTSLTGVRRATSAGEAKKALQYFETQAAKFVESARSEEAPRASLQAASRAYREASNSAFFLGDFQKAIDHGEKAFSLASELDDPLLKLISLSSLHQAYRDIQNDSKAKELIETGIKLARRYPLGSTNRTYWEAIFSAKNSSYFRAQHKYPEAIEAAERAISLYEDFLSEMPDSDHRSRLRKETATSNIVLLYGRLARIYLTIGDTTEALKQYQRGLSLAQEKNLSFPQVSLIQGLGDVYYRREQFHDALDQYKKALNLARQQQRSEYVSAAARRMGDAHRAIGNNVLAMKFYRESIEQIESIRSLLSSQSNRQLYFGGGLAAYTGLIATLWNTRAFDEAFHFGERIRSRTFLDMLGTKVQLTRIKSLPVGENIGFAESSDWEDSEEAYQLFVDKVRRTDPEHASLMNVQPLTLKQVQALLEPNQTLLEYLITPQKIYLWVVDKKQLRALAISLSQKELVAKVEALRSAISDLLPLKEYQDIARDLHQQLVTPAKRFISGKELIVVPHGVLHYVPFQALYSTDGKYLVEDYLVTYLSSASLMQFTQAKRKAAGQKVFAIGNPNLEDSKPQLPLAELEAKEIRRLYPQSAVFVKSEGSEEKVKALAPNYDVLHFAAHAELKEDNPLSSAILFNKEGKEDGRLEVREIFGMDLKASLVVLSGCETGLGKLSTGDELVGLTRAFIYAGTPSVVASLWKVDDASTAYLMSSFYENLRTKTKVESLRQAQLDMIRGEVSSELLAQRGVGGIGKLGQTASSALPAPSSLSISTSHPYFWAPFILVGDGR